MMQLPAGQTLPNDTWLYVVLVRDADGISMWINGVKLTTYQRDWNDPSVRSSSSADIQRVNGMISGTAMALGGWWGFGPFYSRDALVSEMRLSNIARVPSTAPTFNPSYAATGVPIAPLNSDPNTVAHHIGFRRRNKCITSAITSCSHDK
jgi:hypothetical protein